MKHLSVLLSRTSIHQSPSVNPRSVSIGVPQTFSGFREILTDSNAALMKNLKNVRKLTLTFTRCLTFTTCRISCFIRCVYLLFICDIHVICYRVGVVFSCFQFNLLRDLQFVFPIDQCCRTAL